MTNSKMTEDGVYIVQGGIIIEKVAPKEFGQTTVYYMDGKAQHVEETGRRKLKKNK